MICAIDVATRKTGIVVLDAKNKKIPYQKVFEVPKKYKTRDEIVGYIYEKSYAIMTEILKLYTIEFFILEDVLQGSAFIKTAISIEASRVAFTIAIQNSHKSNPKIVYANPQVVKYHHTKKRGAKKDELKSFLILRYPEYNLSELGEDELDAFALGTYAVEKGL